MDNNNAIGPVHLLLERLKQMNLFGMGLPKRDKLRVWEPQWNRFIKLDTDRSELLATWDALQDTPLLQLQEIDGFLKKLNRFKKTGRGERFSLFNLAMDYSVPILEGLYCRYRQGGGVADGAKRAEIMELAIEVSKGLAEGYLILFELDYQLPNWRYGKVRDRLPEYAFRVMEMVWFLQFLYAMRYRPMPANYLYAVNRLVYLLLAYESIEGSRFMRITTRFLPSLERDALGRAQALSWSVRELFVAIQLFTRVEVSLWPTDHLHVIGSYLRNWAGQIAVYRDPGGELAANVWWLHYAQEGPILPRRPEGSAMDPNPEAICLDISPLLTALGKDLEIARQRIRDYGPRMTLEMPLLALNDPDRLAVVGGLLRDWQGQGEPLPEISDRFRDALEMRVYISFGQAYPILNDMVELTRDRFLEKHRLNCSLSQGSAILSNTDPDAESKSKQNIWQLSGDPATDAMVQLRTRESDRGRGMRVGDLLAMTLTLATEYQPCLGWISRLIRLPNQVVVIMVQMLTTSVEAVRLTRSGTLLPLPGLFYESGQDSWRLVVPRHPLLTLGVEVVVRCKKGELHWRLAEILGSGGTDLIWQLLPLSDPAGQGGIR